MGRSERRGARWRCVADDDDDDDVSCVKGSWSGGVVVRGRAQKLPLEGARRGHLLKRLGWILDSPAPTLSLWRQKNWGGLQEGGIASRDGVEMAYACL